MRPTWAAPRRRPQTPPGPGRAARPAAPGCPPRTPRAPAEVGGRVGGWGACKTGSTGVQAAGARCAWQKRLGARRCTRPLAGSASAHTAPPLAARLQRRAVLPRVQQPGLNISEGRGHGWQRRECAGPGAPQTAVPGRAGHRAGCGAMLSSAAPTWAGGPNQRAGSHAASMPGRRRNSTMPAGLKGQPAPPPTSAGSPAGSRPPSRPAPCARAPAAPLRGRGGARAAWGAIAGQPGKACVLGPAVHAEGRPSSAGQQPRCGQTRRAQLPVHAWARPTCKARLHCSVGMDQHRGALQHMLAWRGGAGARQARVGCAGQGSTPPPRRAPAAPAAPRRPCTNGRAAHGRSPRPHLAGPRPPLRPSPHDTRRSAA